MCDVSITAHNPLEPIDPKVMEFVRVVSLKLQQNQDNLRKIRFVHHETFVRVDIYRRRWLFSSGVGDDVFQKLSHDLTALLAEYSGVFEKWTYTVEQTKNHYALVLVKEPQSAKKPSKPITEIHGVDNKW